jgi:hypothetical protein
MYDYYTLIFRNSQHCFIKEWKNVAKTAKSDSDALTKARRKKYVRQIKPRSLEISTNMVYTVYKAQSERQKKCDRISIHTQPIATEKTLREK